MKKGNRIAKLEAEPECLIICDYVASYLRAVGFNLSATSMKSEACYYSLPGHIGLLRVAAHKRSRTEDRFQEQLVISSVTFSEASMCRSKAKVDAVIAGAIGRYIMKQKKDEIPPFPLHDIQMDDQDE